MGFLLGAFFDKFILLKFQVRDAAEANDLARIAKASPSPVETNTCRSNLTPNCIIWACLLDFEKLKLAWFQSD